MSTDPDLAATEWHAGFTRVSALVEETSEETMLVRVPATPDWTARDLLSHMVGLVHDVLADDEPDDHHPAWTRAQVEARAGRSAAELLAEWRGDAEAMLVHLRERAVRPLNDLLIHEQDLRGALGRPGARDTAGLRIVRDALAGRLAGRVEALGLPPVRLETTERATDGGPDWSWQSHPGEPGAVLRASSYDLTRALTTRRTADQLRSWVVAGDLEPHLPAFAQLGDLPREPLPE